MFNSIVGNEHNKKLLESIIDKNKIGHSYIFAGEDSIGKFLFAMEFSKAILCTNNIKPCNKCKSCIEFETMNNPDFGIINPDGNSIKIDQIRELIKKVYEKPIISNKKVFIINNSNLMNQEAQNCLLKTLEEPPEYITIILVSSNSNLFLPTVKSRCSKIIFNKLTSEELKKVLREKYKLTTVSDLVINIADGSIQKALNIIEKESDYTCINNIYSSIEKISLIDIINSKEQIFKEKETSEEILDYINLILFEKAKTNMNYTNCIKIIEETKERLKRNNNFDMTIDNLNMALWEEIHGKYNRN